MSVAFRRESDEEHLEPKFELPIPPGPNFVTSAGLAQIEAQVARFEASVEATTDETLLKEAKRDLRYWRNRMASAQLAPPPRAGTVGIGSRVRFELRGKTQTVEISGFDEADPASGRIAFSAPLARALLGGGAGEFVDFAGEEEAIEIVSVDNS
ncbi:MAG: GreA/GreB family elongation factor [Pseudomonadota bacterium]|nr:GreA/GreB family elongation factor [Pseudomonadota bacterium]